MPLTLKLDDSSSIKVFEVTKKDWTDDNIGTNTQSHEDTSKTGILFNLIYNPVMNHVH